MPPHPDLYGDPDRYSRKEVDDRDAETLASAKRYADGKYTKPETGIPASDLSSGVQASLAKADTALQEHQDITGKVDKTALFDNPDTTPKVKSALLPSYVDDVLEYSSVSAFPATGETGKIYVALDTNSTYRWGGTEYVQVGGGGQIPVAPSTDQSASGKPADAKATGDALAAKQDTIADLSTIRSGAAAGATAYQKPADGIPSTDLASAVQTALTNARTPTPHGHETHAHGGSDEIDGSMLNVGGEGAYASTAIATAIDDMNTTIGGKADASSLANVATSGDYDDLDNKPTIPDVLNTVVDQSGNTLSEFVGVTEIVLGGLPPHYEVLAQSSSTGNLYMEGSGGHSDLTEPPKINGDTQALAKAIAGEYEEYSSSCSVGSLWTYKGKLYRCITAVTSSDGWDASKWTETSIVELTDSPAFTGTPTAPTAPAGTNTTQIATTAFVQTATSSKADASALRYSLASPTVTTSGTTATVACEDRAINDFTVATGITSLTITPPAAVTGRARDFFCRVTLTDSSLPTVTLSGATIDIGSSEVAGMTQGVNLLMFTEIASGHWLASRRSAS